MRSFQKIQTLSLLFMNNTANQEHRGRFFESRTDRFLTELYERYDNNLVVKPSLNHFAEYYSTEFSTLNISFEIDFNLEVETRNIILMQISLRNQF